MDTAPPPQSPKQYLKKTFEQSFSKEETAKCLANLSLQVQSALAILC